MIRIGTAGWSVPKAVADRFAAEGTHLQRYGSRLNAVEINSSFYRHHRRATYERWADGVPDGFRFAVKVPKTITHERRLTGCDDIIERLADEVAGLGRKLGPLLVQLPPSFAFPGDAAWDVLGRLSAATGASVVFEPRHESWFAPEIDRALAERGIARVAADPPPAPGAELPGGSAELQYWRLHGSPRIYWSDYSTERIAGQAETCRSAPCEIWTIFDNTAAGAAAANALALHELVGG